MKVSKKLIIFYKAYVVEPICKKINDDGANVSMQEVDSLLKVNAKYDFKSTTTMTIQQLQELIEKSFIFAEEKLNLKLGYPKDELDDLIDLNFDRHRDA